MLFSEETGGPRREKKKSREGFPRKRVSEHKADNFCGRVSNTKGNEQYIPGAKPVLYRGGELS